jgi:nitrile hydratase accessory protein
LNPPAEPPADPVFAEPWQAQAFALAMRLSQQGHFTWKEWTTALAAELATDLCDDGTRYYDHWLSALERLLIDKGLCTPADLARLKEAWADAYRRTPHGQPVELER